ncbi:hypothetical protein [Streptosporangium roseum]|uniref:hypothetical protein n=1 Tax=Streptosporangium roseum TaxID=2001 RepID=UPI0018CC2758|nr:hypothetical protein [Streptosporangium roseum]
MSKQTTFTLTFLVGLSVLVPGSAGYLSAKMDAVQRAYRDLVSLESRFREEQLLAPVQEEPQIQTIAVPAMPCEIPPLSQPKRKRAPAPPALIPVPVEALPAETLPGAPAPAEGLRIEPLPDEPGPDEPGAGRIGGRLPFAEHGDEAGRQVGRDFGREAGRPEPRDQIVISERSMVEEEAPLPSVPLRRIPSGTGYPGSDQAEAYPGSDQAEAPTN